MGCYQFQNQMESHDLPTNKHCKLLGKGILFIKWFEYNNVINVGFFKIIGSMLQYKQLRRVSHYKEHVMMAISLLADEGLALVTKWIGAVQMWLKDF